MTSCKKGLRCICTQQKPRSACVQSFCLLFVAPAYCHTCIPQVDSSTTTLWTGLFQIAECLVRFYNYYVSFIEILVFNANSVDPDHTLQSAAILGFPD